MRDRLIGQLPVPLPKDYMAGLDSQKAEEEVGQLNISGGRLRRGGDWHAPLVTISGKAPLGTLLLLAAAIATTLFPLRHASLSLLGVWVPPLFMLGLSCSQTGLNWAARYQLIAFPFLFVGAGRLAQMSKGRPWARFLILLCLLWDASALLRARPFYLSYGNELVGGPVGAQKLFLGSNFDWGQDLLRLKRWCDENPHSLPIAFSFYGAVYPKSVGLQVRPLPGSFEQLDGDGDAMPEIPAGTAYPFYWAISSNVLNGMPGLTLLADGTMQQALVRSPLLKPENAAALVGAHNLHFSNRLAVGTARFPRRHSIRPTWGIYRRGLRPTLPG